mmetsp:Transcript_10824/g.25721  ORF Transcript_10824/g.25721 Transcript_10824/m.25721 type:complete len:332 (+) Transcript_10824:483-1478(+)
MSWAASSLRRLGPLASASAILSSTEKMALAALGMYFSSVFFRFLCSRAACTLEIFPLSCSAHCMIACFTAATISSMSSPMYSFPAPLKGIFVDTMLTNTPTLSEWWLILYACQLMRLVAVLVITSEPASNSSGMRFAYRNTLIPGLRSFPPRLTPASTMNACPSKTLASLWCVATISGRVSLRIPRRRLYSPAGLRCLLSGSLNRASCSSWCRRTTWRSSSSRGGISGVTPLRISSMSRPAYSLLICENSVDRKPCMVWHLVSTMRRLMSSRSTAEGWCLISFGGTGIFSVRRRKSTLTLFRSSSALYLNRKVAYGVMTAICRRYLRILER